MRPESELSGVVTAASGEPIAGASVFIYAGRLPCPARARWPDTRPIRTNAQGQYGTLGYVKPPDPVFCLRVVAVKPNTTDSAVVQQAITDTTRTDISIFHVNVTFPE